jgi:DNA-binding CsgD family transcriptional regulator
VLEPATDDARLEYAQRAYEDARLRDASTMLDRLDATDPKVALLQARVSMDLGRPTDVLRLLLQLEPPANPALAAERSLLLGMAYGHSHDYDAGLAEIEKGSSAATTDALRADAAYFKAIIHWMRHDNVAAESALLELRAHPDANQRGRGQILQAWVEIGRQDTEKHMACLLAALDEFESIGERANVSYFARALEALAALSREMYLPEIAARVRRLAKTLPWTPDLNAHQATVLRAFGWIDALEGNTIAAFREFKEAAAIAPTDPWRLLSMLDRAFLAASTGERSFADDQLTDAIAFAERIDWDKAGETDRVALLVLAQLVAQTDPPAAVVYLSRFRNLQGTARSITLSQDLRYSALMSLAGGIARATLGDTNEAERLLSSAWSIFQAFSFEWRAALAAHHLFGVTGSTKWRELAKQHIRNYPKSWLAGLIHAGSEVIDNAPHLTPAQRQVFEALCEGASTIAIAKRLARSPHTVRNHISDIFTLFGVRSRAELLALLRKH